MGSGSGALVWPRSSLPAPASVDWSRVRDVPIALVTGSNGKTTVVRLLAAMTRSTGRVTGFTSTDGVMVGTAAIAEGDFSGPSGARLALRHPRGGDRDSGDGPRWAAPPRAPRGAGERAVVTNVAEDHLGEFGIESLAELADTKLLVAKTAGRSRNPGAECRRSHAGGTKPATQSADHLVLTRPRFSGDRGTYSDAGGTAVVVRAGARSC